MTAKRITALLLAVLCALSLFGCGVTEETGYDHTLAALKEAEKVTVHLYGKEEESLVVPATDELSSLMAGEWKEAAGQDGGVKLLTVTVGTQHEVTFFDNGRAMIYYGFTSVVERDRRYYEVKLEKSISDIEEYAKKHGIDASCAIILDMFCREEDKDKKISALEISATLCKEESVNVSLSSGKGFDELFAGSWRSCEKRDGGALLMSLTVDSKYVLEIYEKSLARIAEINSQGDEKNSSYYSVTLEEGIDSLYAYCLENAKVSKAD